MLQTSSPSRTMPSKRSKQSGEALPEGRFSTVTADRFIVPGPDGEAAVEMRAEVVTMTGRHGNALELTVSEGEAIVSFWNGEECSMTLCMDQKGRPSVSVRSEGHGTVDLLHQVAELQVQVRELREREEIAARLFVVVNKEGKQVAKFGCSGNSSHPALTLSNPRGEKYMSMFFEDDLPGIRLFSDNGDQTIDISFNADGKPSIELQDRQGRTKTLSTRLSCRCLVLTRPTREQKELHKCDTSDLG